MRQANGPTRAAKQAGQWCSLALFANFSLKETPAQVGSSVRREALVMFDYTSLQLRSCIPCCSCCWQSLEAWHPPRFADKGRAVFVCLCAEAKSFSYRRFSGSFLDGESFLWLAARCCDYADYTIYIYDYISTKKKNIPREGGSLAMNNCQCHQMLLGRKVQVSSITIGTWAAVE